MSRIRGIGSTRSTNRPQGGGNSKWGPPSRIGVPANLNNAYSTNSVSYDSDMVNRMTPTTPICVQQTLNSYITDVALYRITFVNDYLTITPIAGMTISSTGFSGTITNVANDGTYTTVTYTTLTGAPPTLDPTLYTIKNSAC